MTSITTLLVERTDHLHDRFDAQYETVLFFDLTYDIYRAFVRKLYGFYKPAEELLASVQEKRAPACLPFERKRVPALLKDLHALGETDETIANIPRCQLPALHSVPLVLGYLYIIEGSIFGNEPVAQQLRRSLQIDEENGAAFFSIVEPEQVRPRWQAFLSMLTAYAEAHPEDVEAIITGALETIHTYESWLFEGKVTRIKRIDPTLHGHSHSHGHGHAHAHDHDHYE
jgi:heme oxygenase